MLDKEKDGTEDVDMSKSLKGPVISNGGDEKMALDQKNSSTKNEDSMHCLWFSWERKTEEM